MTLQKNPVNIPPGGVVDLNNVEIAYCEQRITNKELVKRRKLFSLLRSPILISMGSKILLILRYIGILPKALIIDFFNIFCGGESLLECKTIIDKLGRNKIKSIPDYSVEGGATDSEIDDTFRELKKSIVYASENRDVAAAVFKMTSLEKPGFFSEVSSKISDHQEFTVIEQERLKILSYRLSELCDIARLKDVKIMVDAEESWNQVLIDLLALNLMEEYNQSKVIVINTYQTYLRMGYRKLISHHEVGRIKGFKIGAKIVRGAYIEQELTYHNKRQTEPVVHSNKAKTDRDYNDAITYCLKNIPEIHLLCGTHNIASVNHCISTMMELGIPNNSDAVLFSQLYGMGDTISYNLAKHGYNVSKYLPYGNVNQVLPYLIRRAQENSSSKEMVSREYEDLNRAYHYRKLKSHLSVHKNEQ